MYRSQDADPSAGDANPAAAQLELLLLGPFEACISGRPLPQLRTRKGHSLLALLALRAGKEVERNWLAGTLWPESSDSQALANLRRCLTDLRAAMGDCAPALQAPTPHTLALLGGAPGEGARVQVDVDKFDMAIASGRPDLLAEAIALYRGPLMEGCTEEWVGEERLPREQALLAALEQLASVARANGNYGDACNYLRRAVAVEPFRESAVRALMECLGENGEYIAALEVYRELRRRLREELNSPPDPETRALFHHLRSEAQRRAEATAREATARGADARSDHPGAASLPVAASPAPAPAYSRPQMLDAQPPPQPITGIVGRTEERRLLAEQLHHSRLVTLTGPGGVGKTRLAIQVAADLAGSTAAGVPVVGFVDLTPLSDPDLVAHTVAAAFSLREDERRGPEALLAEALRPHAVLLVVDNCEHVVEQCARLVRLLLESCPRLRVLATGRQPLGLLGESVWPLASLAVPNGEHPQPGRSSAGPLALLEYPAVRLFVERARLASPGFELTARNAETVGRLCRRLDGIPLALELAAARLRVLTLEQIAARLDDRFRLLAGGNRASLPRHQTLRATMDWSYELLSEAERVLLRRLSIFAGGFSLEAVEATCFPIPGAERGPALDCLELLALLVDKSLVKVEHAPAPLPLLEGGSVPQFSTGRSRSRPEPEAGEREPGEEPRYRLLETTREYARNLLDPAEAGELRERHAAYFTSRALEAAAVREAATSAAWLDRLAEDQDNLRAALDWLARDGAPRQSIRRSLALGASLCRFWLLRGSLSEGLDRLTALLNRDAERSQERADTLDAVARLAAAHSDYPRCLSAVQQGLAVCTAGANLAGVARLLDHLGSMAAHEGRHEEALFHFQHQLRLWRALGDDQGATAALSQIGATLYRTRQYERASVVLREVLARRRAQSDEVGCVNPLHLLCMTQLNLGDGPTACRLNDEALAITTRLRDRRGIALSLLNRGVVFAALQDDHAAYTCYALALPLAAATQSRLFVAFCLGGMAEMGPALGNDREANLRVAHLYGAAEALRASIRHEIPPTSREAYEELLRGHRNRIDPAAFDAARAEGARFTHEEAVAYALQEPGLAPLRHHSRK